MRTFASTRSVPPKLRANTRNAWLFDQSSATADARDICGYSLYDGDLTQSGSPACAYGFGSAGARSFSSSDHFEGAMWSGTQLDGTISVVVGFKLSSSFTAEGTILQAASIGDGTDTAIEIRVDANRNLVVLWSYDTGSGNAHTTMTFTGYKFELNKPYEIAVVRSTSDAECRLYVNGERVETNDSDYEAPVGSSNGVVDVGQRWQGGYSSQFVGDISCIFLHTAALTDDEVMEDFRRAMLWDGESTLRVKVEVMDHGSPGTYRDLTNLCGTDWLTSAEINDSSDDACEGLTVRLKREVYKASLAKYHDNYLNRPDDWSHIGPTHPYVEDGHEDLLELTRAIRLYYARVPMGVAPVSSDWCLRFEGYITDIAWEKDPIVVEARDKGDKLADAYIRRTTTFPTDSGTAVSLESIIRNSDSTSILEYIYDQGWIDEDITLQTPVATPASLAFDFWEQERDVVLGILQDAADEIGWCCRYRWCYTTGQYELTLYQPQRSKTFADACFTPTDYKDITQIKVSKGDIRNIIQGVFESDDPGTHPTDVFDHGTWEKASNNQPGQCYIIVKGSDAAVDSTYDMARYREQWMEIMEGSTRHITSFAQMKAMLVAICLDLYKPTAVLGMSMLCFPELETEDMLYVAHDDHHSTVDFRMAVFELRHSFDNEAETEVKLRGKPSGGAKRHLLKECRTSGALPAIRDKADLRAGRTARWRLQPAEFISDRLSEVLVKNPDFTRQSFGATTMADAWEVVTGAFGTDVEIDTSSGKLGNKALKLNYNAGLTAAVWSNYFPVSDEMALELYMITKHSTTGITSKVDVAFYTDEQGSGEDIDTGASKATATSAWEKIKATVDVPSGKKFARLKVYTSGLDAAGEYALFDFVTARLLYGYAAARQAAHQHIDKASDPVKMTLDTEIYDYTDSFDTTNSRFTAQRDGQLEVNAFTYLYLPSSGGDVWKAHLELWINGYPAVQSASTDAVYAGGDSTSHHWLRCIATIESGDYAEIYVVYDTDYSGSTSPQCKDYPWTIGGFKLRAFDH